jgi:hypothetical protein
MGVEERRLRIAPSLLEWLAAALAVIGLVWIISGPVQRALGRRVDASLVDQKGLPPGVPAGATVVPVMLLPDGRELRQGDPHTRLEEVLPTRLANPPEVSQGPFGARYTRSYTLAGTKFFVVCERTELNGQMKVAGIYFP